VEWWNALNELVLASNNSFNPWSSAAIRVIRVPNSSNSIRHDWPGTVWELPRITRINPRAFARFREFLRVSFDFQLFQANLGESAWNVSNSKTRKNARKRARQESTLWPEAAAQEDGRPSTPAA